MSRATAVAPANIAFVKYWGTRDRERVLPFNPSISMTLDRCVARCSVELEPGPGEDSVAWLAPDGRPASPPEGLVQGVRWHLDRLRAALGIEGRFAVETGNSFPTGAGLASSAAGFAALALAVATAAGRRPDAEELAALARAGGSGSAARSALGGYVEWPVDAEGAVRCLAPASHWDLRDVVVVVDESPKVIGSREGHRRAPSSPYFGRRLELVEGRLERVREALRERDFSTLAEAVEEDAVDLHLIAMSSRPPIFYWAPETLVVLEGTRTLRADGLDVCATIDAGPNVHLICTPEAEDEVVAAVEGLEGVLYVVRDRVGTGPLVEQQDLSRGDVE